MNKLWVRLSLAFWLITVIAITLAGLLTNYQLGWHFQNFVVRSQAVDVISPLLADHYAAHHSWQGVDRVFETMPGPGRGMGMGQGMGQSMGMRYGQPGFLLTDASGQVVYSTSANRPLTETDFDQAIPIRQDEQIIGYLVVDLSNRTVLPPSAQSFLNQTNWSLLQAGLVAGGMSLLMGLVVARGLSAPLGRLATAAQHIAQGELSQRVSVKGAEEIVALAHSFNEMAAHLEQAETLRRNLVADVAHELRTPLSVIQGNLQAILDDVYPLDKAEIASLYDESLTLSRLINDLRELSQAESGQLSLHLSPIEPATLITTTVDLFAELAHEKDIRLDWHLPRQLLTVQADSDRLRQVLHNLLSNALRHTPAGGQITVAGKMSRSKTKAGLSQNGSSTSAPQFLEISVTDSGEGISPTDLPQVFSRFWRADRSRSREQGGSGLGLAIAQQLIQAHGGQMGVASQLGQGSCFWFTLPIDTDKDLL